MPSLTDIPGLPPDAIEQLTACGVESAEMLAAVPAAEIHRVLELSAWQKGKLNRAPTLDMVHLWARLARQTAGDVSVDHIPEAIVMPRQAPAPDPQPGGFVPKSQRALLEATGPPVPAAAPMELPDDIQPAIILEASTRLLPKATPLAAPAASPSFFPGETPAGEKPEPAGIGFNTFDDYQSGKVRAMPLSRHSIDAPLEERVAIRLDRPVNSDDFPRTMRRGVLYPTPVLLVFGAITSLLWRLALFSAIVAVPWLILMVPRPSVFKVEILTALGILTVLGVAQLIFMSRLRCRVCTCHLLHSRNTIKNRKAHLIRGLGYTASLALHLLLFQWFRCMYCGTAIKLWTTKAERDERDGLT